RPLWAGSYPRLDVPPPPANLGDEAVTVGERKLVREQHGAVRDRDHVIVESSRRNGLLALRGKDSPLRIEAEKHGGGSRRLDVLARGKGSPRHPIDENLHAGFAVRRRQSHMIG